jgi:hypothetical protein
MGEESFFPLQINDVVRNFRFQHWFMTLNWLEMFKYAHALGWLC